MPSSRRASWILLPYILNESCKRRARKDMHETQGDVSVRDQLYTTIFFPLNKHLQTAQATSHLFVSPQENLTLPPACLTGTNLLPFVGLTDTHTHTTNKCSPPAFQSVASTSESEKDLPIPKFFPLCQPVQGKKSPSSTRLHCITSSG